MTKSLAVTPEDYFNVLTAISSSFLETQPNNSHTFIFRNYLYVCQYDEVCATLGVRDLVEEDFYKFLGEFSLFAFGAILKAKDAANLILHTPQGFDFTINLLPHERLGIRKTKRKNSSGTSL